MSRYQPEWVNGREVGTGRRDAAGRYKAIADYLGDDMRGFHVLDLGAYNGYFSRRLAEDFGAHCVAADDYVGLTDAPGVKAVRKRLSMPELTSLGSFDVVLCLSVLHHLPDWRAYLDALVSMAPLVFIETAHPDEVLPKAKAHGQSREIEAAVDALAGAHGTMLAFTPGHDARHARPLWVIDRRTKSDPEPAPEPAAEPEEKPKPVKRPRRRASKPVGDAQ
ncbi:bifunctional 2-polyprenyl-6-hydroxyphenol methylase/3-demethylubiquinol 3-O-methyltransferase UbiG [Nocardia sp. CC227C]|uniref:class I SAM-dependent methyltransferase n=1 Tax=Nocardia sp. CC227C TaxID=3044562 RepID=UPI00278C2617|nr:methyltransferase domain-containing protein [Nocardia sp. CC227C]